MFDKGMNVEEKKAAKKISEIVEEYLRQFSLEEQHRRLSAFCKALEKKIAGYKKDKQ